MYKPILCSTFLHSARKTFPVPLYPRIDLLVGLCFVLRPFDYAQGKRAYIVGGVNINKTRTGGSNAADVIYREVIIFVEKW